MPFLLLSSLLLLEANVTDFYNVAGISSSRTDKSNNSILFLAYNVYLKQQHPPSLEARRYNAIKKTTYTKIRGYYDATPFQLPKDTMADIGGFSIDNMTALYYHGANAWPALLKKLPIFHWNGRTWWHPNGWTIFLCTKYPVLKYFPPFYIMIVTMMLWAATREKTRTTGFLLWAIRLEMLNMPWHFEIFEALIPWKKIENAFIYYHTMGYTNTDNLDNHPNVKAARELGGYVEEL